jgi:hypothetical protein
MEVTIVGPSTPFCDVGSNRCAATPHLARQPKQFVLWKTFRTLIDGQCKFMRFLPNLKISKVLHVGISLRNDGSCGWRMADGENFF